MLPLPVELWTQIFRPLSKQNLTSVARTCLSLRDVAQPILFEEVNFEMHNDDAVDMFVRSITEQPMFTLHVRALTLVPRIGIDISSHSSSHPVLSAVKSFPNLRFLTLNGFLLDSNLRHSLRLLPRLDTLKLNYCGCDFDESSSSDTGKPLSGNFLSLHLASPRTQNGWSDLIPKALRSLHLSSRQDHQTLLSVIMQPSGYYLKSSLTDLTFTWPPPANIVPFLASCPRLLRLSLPRVTQNSLPQLLPLPPDTIPHLQDFTGGAEFTEEFVRGRPVHAAKILLGGTPADSDAVRSLQLSTVPVRTLYLCGSIAFSTMQHTPATLHGLAWDDWRDDQSAVTWRLQVLSRLPDLRTLKWKLANDNRAELVQNICRVCRSIEVIEFGILPLGWTSALDIEVWLRRNDGTWIQKPYTLRAQY